jgi:hypothetical protein
MAEAGKSVAAGNSFWQPVVPGVPVTSIEETFSPPVMMTSFLPLGSPGAALLSAGMHPLAEVTHRIGTRLMDAWMGRGLAFGHRWLGGV